MVKKLTIEEMKEIGISGGGGISGKLSLVPIDVVTDVKSVITNR